jgi:hypothetical protein
LPALNVAQEERRTLLSASTTMTACYKYFLVPARNQKNGLHPETTVFRMNAEQNRSDNKKDAVTGVLFQKNNRTPDNYFL